LPGEHCPHRKASLAFGRNEEGGLRCLYHGWKFDCDGRVLEMPSEPALASYQGIVPKTQDWRTLGASDEEMRVLAGLEQDATEQSMAGAAEQASAQVVGSCVPPSGSLASRARVCALRFFRFARRACASRFSRAASLRGTCAECCGLSDIGRTSGASNNRRAAPSRVQPARRWPRDTGGFGRKRLSSMIRRAEECVGMRKVLAFICSALPPAIAAVSAEAAAPDRCLALAGLPQPSLVLRARFEVAQLKSAEARISYIGHSTFVIESALGVRIATDYNDYVKPRELPDIVTMNRAHDTHFTHNPEPGIRHVLRGWNPEGGAAIHDVSWRDVRVRNIPTNIRGWDGGTAVYGNSVFIVEVAGLCIAHLGHLHHTLTVQQLGQIGQMDVVLVPVDGSYTLDLEGMVEVLKALKAPLMIPMHYFSSFTLDRFLARVRDAFEIQQMEVPTLVVSRATLPTKPQVLVLPGR